MGAIAFPLILLAIPAANLLLNPVDFRARWIDDWVTTLGVGIAIAWFVYALWPSAFRLLSGGPHEISIEGNALVLGPTDRQNLRDLSAIEILRPWLQHPRIELRFPGGPLMIETAYQPLGERKSVEDIANSITSAARPSS